MSWPPGTSAPTCDNVQLAIRKESFTIREEKKKGNLSEADRVAAEEKKKKLRDAAAQRRKAKKLQDGKDAAKNRLRDESKTGHGKKKRRKLIELMHEESGSDTEVEDQPNTPISGDKGNSPVFPEETDSEGDK